MPEDVVHACALVLEEVATNIIKRDYDNNDERFIEIQLAVDGSGMFRMTVQNDGRPFNPLDTREPDILSPLEDRPIGGLASTSSER